MRQPCPCEPCSSRRRYEKARRAGVELRVSYSGQSQCPCAQCRRKTGAIKKWVREHYTHVLKRNRDYYAGAGRARGSDDILDREFRSQPTRDLDAAAAEWLASTDNKEEPEAAGKPAVRT